MSERRDEMEGKMQPTEAIVALNDLLAKWDRLNGTLARSKAFDKPAATLFIALTGRAPDKDELAAIGKD